MAKNGGLPLWAKILIGFGGTIVGLLTLVWTGLNVGKFIIYHDFYSVKENVCAIPGINSGTTPQGVGYNENEDVILVSSYAKTGSYVYATGKGVESPISVPLSHNGEYYTGHVGGIATHGDYVYLTGTEDFSTDGTGFIYVLQLSDILNFSSTDHYLDIGEGYPVASNASFVFVNADYLFVGEFASAENDYVCVHEVDTEEGKHTAITAVYHLSDFPYLGTRTAPTPTQYISIRDKVQGFAVNASGKIYLSTSWGLASSRIYMYDYTCLKDSGTNYTINSKSAPLYLLANHTSSLKCPAMLEGLALMNGKILTFSESASNKYFFGKPFFANRVFSLAI